MKVMLLTMVMIPVAGDIVVILALSSWSSSVVLAAISIELVVVMINAKS